MLSKSGPGGGVGQKGDGWKEIKYLLSKRGKNILEVRLGLVRLGNLACLDLVF